ncbi:MAG: NfeD family protein [Phycisphaerae bacterium]|jgi:membrane-bound serine protease (ClpP class)
MISLFVLGGMVLILFELLTPTFGPLAMLGVASLGVAVWECFQISATAGIVAIVAMVVGLPIYILLLVRILPSFPLTRSMFLHKFPTSTASAAPEADHLRSMIGKTGVVETKLRPAGAIRVEGRRVSAQAESGIVEVGQTVRIVGVDMANVVVRLTDEPSPAQAGSQGPGAAGQ